ncbi:ABC transporter permease [Trueperella sp. LYQ141]|uniref:ABC transporter permease n=1 Tax=Trueperella sp. LYQ141 TaxID=3391058 RepID=UPI0039839493
MRGRELLREILVSTRALILSSAMIAGIAMIICLSAILTVGRSAAADAQLLARLDEAGTRSFSIVDSNNIGYLNDPVFSAIESLSTVEDAYGFSVARDVVNSHIGAGSNAVAARVVTGNLPDAVRLVEGRWPADGEGIVDIDAQRALGMIAPYGSVTFTATGREVAIVGRYEPVVKLDNLSSVLVVGGGEAPQIIQVITRNYADIDPTMTYSSQIIAAHTAQAVRIQSPTSLGELAHAVTGDLANYSTAILYGVLGIGGVICALVVFTDALSRRGDLGRRMALGATRSVIVGYTVGRTVLPALIGALIGSVVGLVATSVMAYPAPISFVAGTAILTLIIMMIAAIPGALWAANQDPVTVLRTP